MAKLKCDCGRDVSYKKRRGMFFLVFFVFLPGMLTGLALGPGYSGIIPSQERTIPYIEKLFYKDIVAHKQELTEKLDSITKNISINKDKSNTKEKAPKTMSDSMGGTATTTKDNSAIVGTWENTKKNRSFEFEKNGKGTSSYDKDHGNHSYLYSKDFTWQQRGNKIRVSYTLESTFRDGSEFVREKDLSTKATYQLSNNQLVADGEIFYRK